MAIPQTSITINAPHAFRGLLADLGTSYVRSYLNGSGVELNFGIAVQLGADPDAEITQLSAVTDVVAGVLVHRHRDPQGIAGADAGVEDEDPVDVLSRGPLWVVVEEAVAPGDPVFVRFADGNAGRVERGAFRTDDDQVTAIATAFQLSEARWLASSQLAPDGTTLVAPVEINLP